MSPIEPGRLLSDEEVRWVKASLALADLDQKAFAASKRVSYDRLNRMMGRREVVTPSYARLFNRLIRHHLGRYAAEAA